MRLIYIRTAKGLPTRAEQMAAVVAASGATAEEQAEAWVDAATRGKAERADERERLLGAVREGDEVWVARPGILGASQPAVLDYLARVTEMGGVLCVASTGQRYRWHPDAVEAMKLAQEALADERAIVLAKARANIKRRPGRVEVTDTKWEAARLLWADPAVTAEEASKRTDISVRQLYRKLGPKGTAPFTGGPRKRRKA